MPFFFLFLKFSGFAAFHVSFILIMPTLAATSARYRAAEIILVLHLLTIPIFMLALQLEHASTSPIILGHVVGSTFVVRRTTVKPIGAPLPLEGGGLLYVFQLLTSALRRFRAALGGPTSSPLRSRCLPPQMLAQVDVHLRVIPHLHGQVNQQIDQVPS